MGYQFDDKEDTNRQQEYRRSDSVVGTSKVSPKGLDQSKKRIVLVVRLPEGAATRRRPRRASRCGAPAWCQGTSEGGLQRPFKAQGCQLVLERLQEHMMSAGGGRSGYAQIR